MALAYPRGWRVYSFLTAASSIMLLCGLHRDFHALLRDLSVPELLAAALTGIVNLAWYELGYVLGGALKNVAVFLSLPLAGSVTGILSVLFLFTRGAWSRRMLAMHIAFALAVALLSLFVLVARTARGFPDPWRLVASITFITLYLWWAFSFWRTRPRADAGTEESISRQGRDTEGEAGSPHTASLR